MLKRVILCLAFFVCVFTMLSCGASYTVYETADSIAVPNEVGEILDMAQIGSDLFMMTADSVFRMNLETEETVRIFEAKNLHSITDYDEQVYIYCYSADHETEQVSESVLHILDSKGNLIKSEDVPMKFSGHGPDGIVVTDDYYLLSASVSNEYGQGVVEFAVIDKKNLQAKHVRPEMSVSSICAYKNNQVMVYDGYSGNSNYWYIAVYDLKSEEIIEKFYNIEDVRDVMYNPYNDTLLLYGAPYVKEMELKDGSIHSLRLFVGDKKIINETKGYVDGFFAFSDNIVSCILKGTRTINIYNFEKDYPTITIASVGSPQGTLNFLLDYYPEKYDVDVLIKQYDVENKDKFILELMAGTTDFDLYYVQGETASYISTGAYVDLNEFEVLKENIALHESLFETGASHNGEIFGVPFRVNVYDSYLDRLGKTIPASYIFYDYMVKNIDLTKNSYKDKNGTALSKMFTDLKNFQSGETEYQIEENFMLLESDYLIMNPKSPNKEQAAHFLNELINCEDGKYDEIAKERKLDFWLSYYLERTDYTGILPRWKSYDADIWIMLNDLYTSMPRMTDEQLDTGISNTHEKIRLVVEE